MKDLIWDKTVSVEIEEIDDDHRRLMELFNILNHSIESGEAENYIEAVLEELINCTVWHFSHEERLMLKYEYEDIDDHKMQHQNLLDSIRKLQQKFQQERKLQSEEFLEFVELWLTRHILVADMKLGSHLMTRM